MANQEHLDILKRGVEAWNAWRKEQPDEWPDLSNTDLSEALQLHFLAHHKNRHEKHICIFTH